MYTVTSFILITFFLALEAFLGISIIGLRIHYFNFLNLFLPGGAPLLIAPLLVFVEYVSYFARVFSLAIRLFTNMFSGHVLLKIFITFTGSFLDMIYTTNRTLIFFIIFPLGLSLFITSLETLVACFQAIVFTTLIAVYLNDILNIH